MVYLLLDTNMSGAGADCTGECKQTPRRMRCCDVVCSCVRGKVAVLWFTNVRYANPTRVASYTRLDLHWSWGHIGSYRYSLYSLAARSTEAVESRTSIQHCIPDYIQNAKRCIHYTYRTQNEIPVPGNPMPKSQYAEI
jgi:hypothetical protein